MDLLGFGFVAIFYLAILLAGIWIARQKLNFDSTWEQLILANRELGLGIGIFTLIATEVGGAFVNGTAEEVYKNGILWCLAPFGYGLSMTINGLFFVPKLREKGHVTVIDSLQEAFGETLGGLVYIPSCIGDICWTAAVLSALGTTLSVILDVDIWISVSVSAFIAVLYTLVGGMHSVAFTDVVQILFIFGGLWTSIPFMLNSDQVNLTQLSTKDWTGSVDSQSWISYMDLLILIVLGGIPWQPYYQRALAVKTTQKAQLLSVAATLGCWLFMIPPILIGGIAKASLNNSTTYNDFNADKDPSLILPVSLANLTPYWVSILGLSAISAAAMSSVDSSLLSGASYLTHNVYSGIFRPFGGSKGEKILVFRLSVLVLGLSSAVLSLSTSTVYGLWVLAGDLGFVIVFPQFFTAVHCPRNVNKYGSLTAAILAVTLRLAIGEPLIGLPALLPVDPMAFPVKTTLMLLSLFVLCAVSKIGAKFE